jgi:hypothetical protein
MFALVNEYEYARSDRVLHAITATLGPRRIATLYEMLNAVHCGVDHPERSA